MESDTKAGQGRTSWVAFILFYVVLLLIVTVLDAANHVLTLSYWGAQAGLITAGVGLLAVIGATMPDLSAISGVPLAFTVGVLTIIPAVLMGLGRLPNFWPQYFYVALGLAAGSLMTFVFIRVFKYTSAEREQSETEE